MQLRAAHFPSASRRCRDLVSHVTYPVHLSPQSASSGFSTASLDLFQRSYLPYLYLFRLQWSIEHSKACVQGC